MDVHDIPLGGHWGLAIIMIVLATWLVYRFLAPKGFREWRNAGLVQAFIIALYAEMYGFPLTIYFLTSYLGKDIPFLHMRGHLWSTLLGLGDTGAMIEMFIGQTIVIIGMALLITGWTQVYSAQKESRLAKESLYRYVRHPQYTGIVLAMTGQLIHWPTLPTLVLYPAIVFAYYRLAKREERAMLEKYADEYRAYMQQVPMFFPRLRR